MARKISSETRLPFTVDRASRADLPRQVTDGLRAAILSGFFRPGDVLPPIRELGKALGVSVRAPLEAIRILSNEGLLVSRRHVGCVVLGRNEMSWKGHVLIVYPNLIPVFYKSVIEMGVSDRLLKNGYLATRLMLAGDERKGYDFSQLDLVLKQPTSFALVLGDRPKIFRHLAKAGIPYAGFVNTDRLPVGAAGSIHFNRHAADADLVRHCRMRGIRKLVQVGTACSGDYMDAELFRRGGVRLETRKVEYAVDVKAGVGALVRAAHGDFASWQPGKRREAFFFIDDYIARGAMTAMLEHGVRIGEDVLVGTLSNVGIDVVCSKDITRMEMDPVAHAVQVSEAVLAWLERGVFPAKVAVSSVFVPGETL